MLLNLRPGARHGFQPLLTMIYWGNPLFHRQRKKLWETTVMDAPGLPDKRPAERWVIHRRIYKSGLLRRRDSYLNPFALLKPDVDLILLMRKTKIT